MSIVALPLSVLSDDERELVNRMSSSLAVFQGSNLTKEAYYEGSQRLRDLGIAIPPHLRDVETVVGWPGTTVDVLEERLDLEGFISPSTDLGLGDVFTTNTLDVESSLGHLDALIYGVAFVTVGSGADGEPDPLVTVESPTTMTALYDRRTRRVAAALSIDSNDEGQVDDVTLYLPDETVRAVLVGNVWRVQSRDRHNLGRPLVARLVNRPRSGRLEGRSEITRAVRAYTDTAVRTLLGMEVAREFYSSPQRYLLGVDESAFVGADGSTRTGWEAILGRWFAVGRDEDGELPEIGQFAASSPAPYLDQVKGLAQLLAAEAAIPSSYLGFHTENPSSADAIRQAEARLVKRAERRQRMFGQAWLEVARLALLVRDGGVPAEFSQVSCNWRDASTPTRAAAADEVVKLTAAGVLPPDSDVVLDRIGLTTAEKAQVAADRRRSSARQTVSALAAAGQAALSDPVVARLAQARGDVPAG